MKRYGIYASIVTLGLTVCLVAGVPALVAQDDGVELLNAHSYAKAEAKFRETLKKDTANTTARYYLGIALLQQSKYTEALKELKKVKSEQEWENKESRPAIPDQYQIDLALAQAHLGLHQLDEAWDELEAARIEQPDSSDVYLYRGVYYYHKKEFDHAVEDLEKALKLDNKNAYGYYYLGMIYSDKGQPDKMVEVFKMFLQLAPDAPEAPEVKKKVDAAC